MNRRDREIRESNRRAARIGRCSFLASERYATNYALSPWIGDHMRRLIPFLFLTAGIMVVGCEDKPSTPDNKGGSKTSVADAKTPPSKHAGWWCTEHGIPEEECLMCLHSEDDLKKKGDWCDKHDYCKSQCFACDPKLKE